MTKSASPIRLENNLMQAAKMTGKRYKRSTAEQIEYWADIGRSVAGVIDPDILISIQSGLSKVNVEAVNTVPISADDVFSNLDRQRDSGELTKNITTTSSKYQASATTPGLLEEIDQDGNVRIGMFEKGRFVAQ